MAMPSNQWVVTSGLYTVYLLVIFNTENLQSKSQYTEVRSLPELDDDEELPLSKSLGYAVKRSLGKNLEDKKISKEYLELYQEMLKASRESYEKVDEEEAKLETIVGREKAELMKKGVIDHRRSISRMRSPVGRRRVRSQKTRREKLNSQSLRSHQQHIRHAGRDYRLVEVETAQV